MVLAVTTATAHDVPQWRRSMENTAWTDTASRRALLVSHGGDPNYVTRPYDSLSAFTKAYAEGTDAVKADFRVLSDGITGMVMHSSPIEAYESIDCAGKRVENLTLAQATACTMLPTLEHFLSVESLLAWSSQKVASE